jgi:hypothetical protein
MVYLRFGSAYAETAARPEFLAKRPGPQRNVMSSILPTLVVVSALTTLGILLFGVITMIRGGDFNRRNSNRLMRARVIMQGVTLALLALMFVTR